MDTSQDSLKNIQKLAKMLDGHQMVTVDEFRSAVSDFINAFAQHRSAFSEISKKNEESMATALKNLQGEFEAIRTDVKSETGMTKEEMKSMLAKCMADMKDMCDEMEARLPKDGQDGLDADEEKIIQEVLAKIKLPEATVLDTPDEVIDKVNLSSKKIKKERVEGLEQAILNSASNAVNALPATTMFVNSKRSKNLSFVGATVSTVGDTSTITIAGDGNGDVVGPASSVDGTPVVFDSTTGKLIKAFVPTEGSVLFAGVGGILAQDNSNLFWDDTNNRLGIGTVSPQDKLHVYDATAVVGNPTIRLEGSTGGYGAGIEAGSVVTGGSYVAMGKAVWDGETSWNTTTSTQDSYFTLHTTLNGTLTERMRVNSAGNVGIGTSEPLVRTDIVDTNKTNASNVTILGVRSSDTATIDMGGTIGLGGMWDGTASAAYFGSIRGAKENATASNYSGYLGFQTVTTGGVLTEKMRIASDGNVGIGTTNPLLGKLQITKDSTYSTESSAGLYLLSAASDTSLALGADATNNISYIQSLQHGTSYTNRALVLQPNEGNVGINTITPGVKLQIKSVNTALPPLGTAGGSLAVLGTTDLFGLYAGTVNTTGAAWLQSMRNDSATAYALLIQPLGGNVGIGVATPLTKLEVQEVASTNAAVDVLGLSRPFNDGVAYGSAASFKLANPSSGSMNTRLDIALLNANSTSAGAPDAVPDTTVMTLLSSGNVGVGLIAPLDRLEVAKAGAGVAGGVITAGNSSAAGAGNETGFGFRANSNFASAGYYSGRIASITPAADNLSDMAFFTYNGTTSSGVERMRILSSGVVGIGTTSPVALLTLGTAGTTAGTMSLAGGTSGVITIQTAAAAGTYTLTLPTSDGDASQVLTTNGSGVLSWTTAGAGNVTKVGTPVNNQLGIWTGDGTLEGDAKLTFDGTDLMINANITNLADITFKTGATGGTIRTGTSAADKFVLQAYDVNGTAYQKVLEADAGNTPTLEVFADSFGIWDTTDETKKFAFLLSGGTTGVTTTLASSPTANRTITFPDATDTLVGKATTDTLTNKTIQGAAISGALTGTGAYIPVSLLNSGTSASATTYWRGDGTWATPAGSGGGDFLVMQVFS